MDEAGNQLGKVFGLVMALASPERHVDMQPSLARGFAIRFSANLLQDGPDGLCCLDDFIE
jgi:hypothetical protein